jgi:hypothetical protein
MNTETNISPYLEPDTRWELFQVSTIEEYVQNFVVRVLKYKPHDLFCGIIRFGAKFNS